MSLADYLANSDEKHMMRDVSRALNAVAIPLLLANMVARKQKRDGSDDDGAVCDMIEFFRSVIMRVLRTELASCANEIHNEPLSLGNIMGMPDSEELMLKYRKALDKLMESLRKDLEHMVKVLRYDDNQTL